MTKSKEEVMKKIISLLLMLMLLIGTVPSVGTAKAASDAAASVTARIYVNGAYQPTEAYKVGSKIYYKIQDIAASVRDLSVRFTFTKDGSNLKINMGENHVMDGSEYSTASLQKYSAKSMGGIQVNGSSVDVPGYIINSSYCFTMKDAAKFLSCGYLEVEKGKGADFQLMTSYKYSNNGILYPKMKEIGNTAFNNLWSGFAASHKGYIYFVSNSALYKMNDAGTDIKKLIAAKVTNINIVNDRIYYALGGGGIIRSMDLNGNDRITHPSALYNGGNQYMKNILIADDSVYCIYNDYDKWANPQNTCNIYQYEMPGRDMIPDTWKRQTIFKDWAASVWDKRIENFYFKDGYFYFGGQWLNRIKVSEWGKKNEREVLTKHEWYQLQPFSDNKVIMMGNEGKKGRWPGKNGYLYTKNANETDNWKLFLKEDGIYTYTVTEDKLIYIQDYDLYVRNLDGSDKKQLLGMDGSSTLSFAIAGDWIIAVDSIDIGKGKATVMKADGTKPSVNF